MKTTEYISDKMADIASSAEDKLFLSKIDDMIRLSEKRGAVYSHFLTEHECIAAKTELDRLMHQNYCFYGIFDDAERKILCVYKEFFMPENDDFLLGLVTFEFKKETKLSHRDFLGALMHLGIKREMVGDIVIDEGIAQIALLKTVEDLVTSEIRKIGNAGVKYNERFPGILKKLQNFKEISGTVASLRLDGVVGLGLNLSRSKTAAIIKGNGIEVNSIPKYDCSLILNEGDVFSVRGYGKFKLSEISGITKKGRIHITVLKYC